MTDLLKRYPATSALICLILGYYAFTAWPDFQQPAWRYLERGTFSPEAINRGQWWRVGTATLMHANPSHLFNNLFGIFVFGRLLEPVVTPFRMLVVFTVTACTGLLLSYWFVPAPTLGASTIGFGLIAVYFTLVLTFQYRKHQRLFGQSIYGVLIFVLFFTVWASADVAQANVNIWGHLGGFLGGIGCGLWVAQAIESGRLPEPWVENELKYQVPDDLVEEIRLFLDKRFADGLPAKLAPLLDGGATASRASEATVTDHYYDTPDGHLLRHYCGFRLRTGEEHALLNLKVQLGSDARKRTEYRFPLPGVADTGLSPAALAAKLPEKDRKVLVRQLHLLDIESPEQLHYVLTLHQHRRQIELLDHAGKRLIMLTLDAVRPVRGDMPLPPFTELEIELDEQAFTHARPARQARLQQLLEALGAMITRAFPQLVPDQTPKPIKALRNLP